MVNDKQSNLRISSKFQIPYPEFAELPESVKNKFESLPTKVNFFRMVGHSPGTFVPIIDLTNAIFKNLTLSDYYKELFVLMVAAHESCVYEWEQHVSIAKAAGVRDDQFIAIAENRLDDDAAFTEKERIFLNFGKTILDQRRAPGVLFKHALEHFSVRELADATIVLGYYRMVSTFIQTFDLSIDPQQDGNSLKK